MNTNILVDREFVLGVDKDWDSHYEIKVEFVKKVAIGDYTYHIFVDKKKGKFYNLSSRYTDHMIEGVLVEKRIVVNLFEGNLEDNQADKQQPRFFATGMLQVPD